ncbi:hypothetical protein [Allohahella marinimesophila]|uniref:Uncharacterized protein n=1 Tax=Allohahella marinimesophila TaxID=1054972 RepID=A0ABP7Q151_9GAMM
MRYGNVANGFKLTALTVALLSLAACGGGGGSSKSKGNPATVNPDLPIDNSGDPVGVPTTPPVNETQFQTLNEAIAGFSIFVQDPVVPSNAWEKCGEPRFSTYTVGERKLNVGFRGDNVFNFAQEERMARIAGLALETTLSNYGFFGTEDGLRSQALPYYVCVKAENSPLNSTEFFAEMGPFDQDKGFYRQAKDQLANSFVERLRTTTDNYDQVYFWFDEGLANYSGDNLLIGSPVTWQNSFAGPDALPNPMTVERLPNDAAGSPSDPNSKFFTLYPYYATVVAYFLSDSGLGLTKEDMANLLQRGVALNNFGAAFTEVSPVDYPTIKAEIVPRVTAWLEQESSTTDLIGLAADKGAVTGVTIQRKPDWQFEPIKGYNIVQQSSGNYSFDSLVYTLDDDNYDLYLTTASGCLKSQVGVTAGKAAPSTEVSGAQSIPCNQIPL